MTHTLIIEINTRLDYQLLINLAQRLGLPVREAYGKQNTDSDRLLDELLASRRAEEVETGVTGSYVQSALHDS